MLKTKTMRNCRYLIILLVLFTSCNDGDIIVNNFEFEDASIKSCDKVGRPKVFFKINIEDVFESISLVTNNASVSDSASILTTKTENVIRFALDNNNKINYRIYDGTITREYFCNTLPPSSPKVLQEFVSVGGTVVITTEPATANDTDTDGDGVPNTKEFIGDTDGDGIPDIKDIDDDGDNVPTRVEVTNGSGDPVNLAGDRDTDQDGMPNYLDPDDDGDGALTKFEVTEADQFPTDPENIANGLAFYLDKTRTNALNEVTAIIINKIDTKYRSLITIQNLQLQNQDGSGEEISFSSYDFGEFLSTPVKIIILPNTTTPEEN